MHVIISTDIEIHNPTKAVKEWCVNNLIINNPDFYKLEQLGKWTGGTPRQLYLYETFGDVLHIPFGCVQRIWHLIGDTDDWTISFHEWNKFSYHSNMILYPYQERAVQATLKHKNGILVMPCGSGKTQSGLEVIARLGGRALWLTHTQDLLNQSKRRAESVLDNVGVGTISEGKVNLGNGITFATVQTLSRLDLTKYRDYWDIVIVDECQHCAGTPTRVTQFYKVVTNLNARYKIGLTATPYRSDGLDKSMFALLGNVFYEVSRQEVANTTCPIKVKQIVTNWFPSDDIFRFDGTIDYMKVIDSLTHDEERFDVVFNALVDIPVGNPIMVLANRVEYLSELCGRYNECGVGRAICLSGAGQSKSAKEQRKKSLIALNNGELDCIFATYQLAKEGLDVPNLRYVVLATPEKDETTVIQSVGRVGRKADGKDCGYVLDFVDSFGMYKGWVKKRIGYYKKIGAEIMEGGSV